MQFGREWTKFAVRFREVSGLESVRLERVDCTFNCTSVSYLFSDPTGSIFGALEILADRSVTRERYLQEKKIPDWPSCEARTFENAAPLDERLERPVLSRRQTSGITSTLSSISSAFSSRILSSGSRLGSPGGTSRGLAGSQSSTPPKGIKEEPK